MGIVIGLTGGIASGKSTVSAMLRDKGFTVIDADVESRAAVEKGMGAYGEIVKHFGSDILNAEGDIDRAKLGAIVFNNETQRLKLNSIVHPAVRKNMLEKRDAALDRGELLVIMDIPLLFESKLTAMIDRTLLVYVDADVQLKRLMERNNFSKEEALARIRAQMPLAEKRKLTNDTIDNNGSIEETAKQLDELLTKYLA